MHLTFLAHRPGCVRHLHNTFIQRLSKEFDFADQGTLTEVLSIQVQQCNDGIKRSHEKYKGVPQSNRKEHKTPAAKELSDFVAAAADSTVTPDSDILATLDSSMRLSGSFST